MWILSLIIFLLPSIASAEIAVTFDSNNVIVSVSGGPGNPKDWISIETPAGEFVNWRYLNGKQVPPAKGLVSASISFPLPGSGSYVTKFYSDNSRNTIGSSANFSVGSNIKNVLCTGAASCETSNGTVTIDVPRSYAPSVALISPKVGDKCNPLTDSGFNFSGNVAIIYLCKEGSWVQIGPMPYTAVK